MDREIKIGTRDSELALWQANTVKTKLEGLGYKAKLVPVKATGDLVLDKPLYELGITGIFTKTLDMAMHNGTIDIAVHSMKDVPTSLPKNIVQAAVLERANVEDILIHKGLEFLDTTGIVATGSLRRKAQWLNKYPNHQVVDLRGNVNTRLQKLADNNWNGAIFARAGLERINLKPENHIVLDWMVPAPAQGAMVVVAMDDDDFSIKAVSNLNHRDTEICTRIERDFLKELEGGCTAPIGALARINKERIYFKGTLLSLDGKEKIEVETSVPIQDYKNFGVICAKEVVENGGKVLMERIKREMK